MSALAPKRNIRNAPGEFLPLCVEESGQVTARMLDRLTTRLLDDGGRRGALSKFTPKSNLKEGGWGG